MAGASPTGDRAKEFRKVLVRLQEELDEHGVSQLTTVIPNLAPNQRTLKKSKELFVILERQSQLAEDNVEELIGWMRAVRLNRAAEILEGYRVTFLRPEEQDTPVSGGGSVRCERHSSTSSSFIKEYMCTSCDVTACPKCLIEEHKGHEKIALDKIGDYVRDRLQRIKTSARERPVAGDYSDSLRKKVQESFYDEIRRLTDKFHALLDDIQEERNNEAIRAMRASVTIEQKAEGIHERLDQVSGRGLSQEEKWEVLKTIKRDTDKLATETEQEAATAAPSRRVDRLSFTRGSREKNTLGVLVYGRLVGANWLRKDPSQLCRTFDERTRKGRIRLLCSCPVERDKIFWDYTMEETSLAPLVVSHRSIFIDARNQLLVATGLTVYFIQLSATKLARVKSSCDGVKSVNRFRLAGPRKEEEGADSWITAMSVHRPSGDDPCSEFIVAFHGCATLYEYTVPSAHIGPGEPRTPTKSFDCSAVGIVGDIVGVAYKRKFIGVIDSSGSRAVTVLECTSDNEDSGVSGPIPLTKAFLIEPPRGLPPGMSPTIVYSTNSKWLLLWQSESPEKKYAVVLYNLKRKSGGDICHEGAVEGGNAPAGICRYGSNALLCLSDGEWETFKIRD